MAIDIKNGKLSERVAREKEALLSAEPRIDIERDKALWEAYTTTDGWQTLYREDDLYR